MDYLQDVYFLLENTQQTKKQDLVSRKAYIIGETQLKTSFDAFEENCFCLAKYQKI